MRTCVLVFTTAVLGVACTDFDALRCLPDGGGNCVPRQRFDCAAGTVDDDGDSSTECAACASGTFCAGGSGGAVACAAGTYDDDSSAATVCVACPSGTFCAGGSARAVACPAGTVDDDGNAATNCAPCAGGSFCAGGATPAVVCAVGTVDDDRNPATACAVCPAGSYCGGGDAGQDPCAPGTRDDDGSASTTCAACPAGSTCPGGTAMATPWTNCPAGSYVDNAAAPAPSAAVDRHCSPCAAGETTTNANAPSCASGLASTVAATSPVVADGLATSTLSITVRDDGGVAVPGQTVTFFVSGSGNTLVQPAAVTDAAGRATATVASTASGRRTVSARVGALPVTGAAVVDFTPEPGLIIAPVATGRGGCVTLDYAVRHREAAAVELLVEYFKADAGFVRATQANSAVHDGTLALSTSTATGGRAHSFLWNTSVDLPHAPTATVPVRLSVISDGGARGVAPLLNVSVGNGMSWSMPTDVETALSVRDLAVGDFNGDGTQDAVVTERSGVRARVLFGRDAGVLTPGPLFDAGVLSASVLVADVDVDGALDLLLAGGSSLRVMRNDGAGTFGTTQVLGTGAAVVGGLPGEFAASSDFNRDGRPDVAVLTITGVSVFHGSDAGLQTALAVSVGGNGNNALHVADLTADGLPDLVVANSTSNTVALMRGRSDGGFELVDAYGTGAGPGSFASADFNRDGLRDLAVGNSTSMNVSVFLATDAGTLVELPRMGIGGQVNELATSDVDGDGRPDLIANLRQSTGVVVARLGRGDGTFALGPGAALGVTRDRMALLDVDLDGRQDVLLVPAGGTSLVLVRSARPPDCDVTLRAPTSLLGSTALVDRASPAAVSDFNGDGKLDVAFASQATQALQVYSGLGGGRFAGPTTYAVGTSPQDVAAGDFDGDGRADLVVANATAASLSVLLNTGSGFDAGPAVGVGSDPRAIAARDFNGDGRADLAVANLGSGTLSVVLTEDGGLFGAALQVPAGPAPGTVLAEDLDGDGVVDLAVGSTSTSAIAVLRGDGTGRFMPSATLDAGAPVLGLSTADFNRDGRMDVVAGGASTVTLLLQTPAGFRSTPSVSITGGRKLVARDFDVDGFADVAVATSSGDLLLLRGTGQSAAPFLPAERVAAAATADGITAADLDGNGFDDALVSSTAAGASLSVVWAGPRGGFQSPSVAAPSRAAVVGDFTRDGRPDVGLAPFDAGALVLTAFDVDGGLGGMLALDGGVNAAFAAADFTGDGVDDLIAIEASAVTVQSLVGEPQSWSVAVPSTGQCLATGDWNGDGQLDVMAGGLTSLSLRYGTRAGFVTPASSSVLSGNTKAVVAGDFNRDGLLDVAAATAGDLRVRLATGAGSFGTPAVYALTSPAESLATADLNRDGNLDLLVLQANATVAVLLGSRTGAFPLAPSHVVGVGLLATVLRTADFNRDGREDVVVASAALGTVTVRLGTGAGDFFDATHFAVGRVAQLGVGDLDGDGLLDLVVPSSRSVAVLYAR